jgi:glyoxylase-like metal-dependent hydrolase (beta-lactamase superfamily II)
MTNMQILNLPLYKLIIPTPFHVGPVNVYLITEPEVVLIDVGPKFPAARTAIDHGLQKFSLRIRDVKKIFITHGHPDHYGQANQLACQSEAILFAPPLDRAHFQHQVNTGFYLQMYQEAAVPAAVIHAFHEGFLRTQSFSEPIENFVPIQELDMVSCGSWNFSIISTPGHTPGSICFFCGERGLLIAADTIIKRITPNPILDEDPTSPGTRFPGLRNYLESLEKARALEPELVCCGHGDEVKEFQPLYQRIQRHHEERQRKLMALLDHGPKTIWRLTQELFPKVAESGLFLALSETFAHLDLMDSLGKLKSSVEDGMKIIQRRD